MIVQNHSFLKFKLTMCTASRANFNMTQLKFEFTLYFVDRILLEGHSLKFVATKQDDARLNKV